MGEPANDNDPNIFHDKELMVADSRSTSPKKGRVYVTWTRFETVPPPLGGISPIVFSQSTDGGATWSPAVVISGVERRALHGLQPHARAPATRTRAHIRSWGRTGRST